MEQYALLAVGGILLIFGGYINRILKVKALGMTIKSLDNIGKETIDDKIDTLTDKILEKKIKEIKL